LCGQRRLGHFDGVALVVAKLFNITQPDKAYFGQKDAQQAAVIQQMVRDLNFPVEIVVCPTVRQEDGLALSSRNAYLNDSERRQATVLYSCLERMQHVIEEGQADPPKIIKQGRDLIDQSGPCQIEYLELVDPQTMQPVQYICGLVLAVVAVRFGACRLIDNLFIDVDSDIG